MGIEELQTLVAIWEDGNKDKNNYFNVNKDKLALILYLTLAHLGHFGYCSAYILRTYQAVAVIKALSSRY